MTALAICANDKTTGPCATDTYEYDAFGNEISHTGTTPNNYLYRGEQWDPDLGLYYLRARYYNPVTGRFTSRDPNNPQPLDESGAPTDPKMLHKYLYAGGDPVNAIDPTGRGVLETGAIDTSFLLETLPDTVLKYVTPYVVKTLVCAGYELLWSYITPNGSNIPAPWDCWEWANGS